MNQILITEKVIMTPEFKRKRKLYKFNFFLSCFLACMLFSCCIYAEYDRNKNENLSQDILVGFQETERQDNTTISVEEDVIVIRDLVESTGEDTETQTEPETQTEVNISDIVGTPKSTIVESVAADGKSYYTEAVLKIPCLGIEYPVLSDTSDELLKISLNRLWGPDPNEIGNYVIVGHNYRNGKMFGKLSNIKIGDKIELTDNIGRTVTYSVYTTYVVDPADVSCTSQRTDGKREVTLITCTSTGKQRFVVKAAAI